MIKAIQRSWKSITDSWKIIIDVYIDFFINKSEVVINQGQSNVATLNTVKKARECLNEIFFTKQDQKKLFDIYEYDIRLKIYKDLYEKGLIQDDLILIPMDDK